MSLTKEQVKERIKYIGASETASILGLSRWSTPLKVWSEKVGAIEPEDISDKLSVEVGNELEELVAKLFTKRTGKKVHRVNETIFHPKYSFLGANLDFRVVGEDALLECKTASGWKAKEWSQGEVPQEYHIQVLQQLAVTGKSHGYASVLIGGNQEFVWARIDRDEETIKTMIERQVSFWNKYVVPKIMPAIITKDDSDVLFNLFPEGDDSEPVELEEYANQLVDSIQAQQQDLKNLENSIDLEKNNLRAMLKDHSIGITDRFKITWKNQITRRIDTQKLKEEQLEIYRQYTPPKKSRVLRISQIKEKNNVNRK